MKRKSPSRKLQAKPKPPEPVEEGYLIGYARVSTADQNPQMQVDALKAAGVDENNIYWEKGTGTSTAKRREFQAMMKDVREGDTVVIWKLDRLGRNAAQLYDTAQKIQAKGANLRVLTTPGMDTSTPMGRAMFGMLAVFAEFEAAIGKERTMAGLARARAAGRIGGATAKHTHAAILEFAKLGLKPGARAAGMSVPGFIKARDRAKAWLAEQEAKNAKRKR